MSNDRERCLIHNDPSDAVEPWIRREDPLEGAEAYLDAAEEELDSPFLLAASEGHRKTIAACRRLVEIARALQQKVGA